MAKKPILTDDFLSDGAPMEPRLGARAPAPLTGETPPPGGPNNAPPPGNSFNAPPPGVPNNAPPPGATRPLDPPAPQATRPAEGPVAGRDSSGHARPKTRIHGFTAPPDAGDGAGLKVPLGAGAFTAPPTVGWLVVTAGPGRGASLGLIAGMNAIGRGDALQVQLDFGDDAISREAHAYVTYDDEARRFFVSHGGKTNLIRRNDAPILATEPLTHGDTLRIGVTSLRFVALCGPDFDWSDP